MRWFVVIILLQQCFCSAGQEFPRTEMDLARITDDLVAFQDEDIPYDEIYENYLQLFSNPLNLNKATAEQLRHLNLLTESQIANLLTHIRENGKLLSVYELQAIDEFDLLTFHRLMPFVRVFSPENELNSDLLNRMYTEQNTYFVSRYERTLERSRGFGEPESYNRFVGGRDKIYLRLRSTRANDFSYGFTMEKDAGEPFGWEPQKNTFGFDYLSYFLQLVNKKGIANLVLGDFQFQFGQGLVLGNSYGFGKGGETITAIRKTNTGFSPYTSVNESGGMRGFAATLRLHPHIFVSPFYSNTRRDAPLHYNNGFTFFSSILSGGMHRNQQERANRKTLGERVFGTVINYKQANLDAGVIVQAVEYDFPLLKFPNAYNQFAFRGRHNINAGIFANYIWKNINIFAESAKSVRGDFAFIGGLLTSLSRELDLAFLYRNYGKRFYPFYGNALSESSASQNETGFYWGLKYRFSRKYSLGGYADLFTFPWLKFRTYAPARGNELLIRLNYQPSRKTTAFCQYRREGKPRNAATESMIYAVERVVKNNLTVNFDYQLSAYLKLKTRAQFSSVESRDGRSKGMTIFQDVVFTIKKFEFSTRHALFDTDNFDNRQYVYERDVWLSYSLPAYEGWGVRNFVIIEYKLNRHISFSGRYARTTYKDRDEIGSGPQMIRGNTRNDLKLQGVLKF